MWISGRTLSSLKEVATLQVSTESSSKTVLAYNPRQIYARTKSGKTGGRFSCPRLEKCRHGKWLLQRHTLGHTATETFSNSKLTTSRRGEFAITSTVLDFGNSAIEILW